MMKLDCSLTQTEINTGKVQLCSLCPISRTVQRMFALHGIHTDVLIGKSSPTVATLIIGGLSGTKPVILIDLPQEVSHWVNMFDSGIKLGPIDFTLELPVEVWA